MILKYIKFCILFYPLIVAAEGQSQDKIIRIYQDADLSNHVESSVAIQQGIKVAFDEVGNQVDGYRVEFKFLNHRGNVIRSKRNYKTFLDDPQALVIYSGLHSPPLISNRSFINENKALTLVPWAAGGPITRYPYAENWIFRLSIDDNHAGEFLVDYAIKTKQCHSPHLLLESTPWGDSNLTNMSKALEKYGKEEIQVTRINFNLKAQQSRFILRKIIKQNDCILLAASAVESIKIAHAMLALPAENRIPIISHWGVSGGNFQSEVPAEDRDQLDLSFIQSCFAFTNSKQTNLAEAVFKRLKKISQTSDKPIREINDLKSAVGFIHAYDLTRLLIEAIKKTGLSGNITKDRNAIRLALEDLKEPLQGLIKTYNQPFSSFDAESNINAHEALDSEDYCMAYFGSKDEILIIPKTNMNKESVK